jgi:hypothetical protein
MIQSENKRVVASAPTVNGRKTAPVFVLGCPRSGTTVLYHMLLSAGNFAVYRTESNVFNLLVPRFRGMRSSPTAKGFWMCGCEASYFGFQGWMLVRSVPGL